MQLKKGISICLIILLAACSSTVDKKAELDKLKKQHDDIADQIKKLETELKLTDSASVNYTDVVVTEVKASEFNHYIEVQGKVDGEDNVAVAPQAPGIVTNVYVKEGDMVRKGQVLAQLDDNVLQQQIAGLNQQLAFATNIFNKQKALWDQKIGSEVQFLTAKNNKESLEKNLATIQQQVDMYKIKSPINGSVEEVGVKVGQMAAAGAVPVFRVVNFSSAKIVADIAEVYAPKVKPGNEVLVYFPDFKEEMKSSIRFSSKYINPTNRTFQVEVRLGQGKVDFRANMIAVVKINDYHNSHAIVLPVNLVKDSQDGKFVYTTALEGGKTVARKLKVEVGQIYNGLAEITSGLKDGDKVISTGFNSLVEGQAVKIK
ncbi:MAG: efflux RND transporter periplasmic adaptor subunit [Bacteroidetes bacterium]|nr:efflux RND transporter periplasmic adaptor subunit [Bacteroidota bacterium]